MKVLIINDNVVMSGGGDAAIAMERRALTASGHDSLLVGFSQNEQGSGEVSVVKEARDVRFRKLQKFYGSASIAQAIRQVIQQYMPDIVHLHLTAKYPRSVYESISEVPVVQTAHGVNMVCPTAWGNIKRTGASCELGASLKCAWNRCVSPLTALGYMSLNSACDRQIAAIDLRFHAPSKYIQEILGRHYDQPISQFYLGVDDSLFSARSRKFPAGVPVVAFVGALVKQKGIRYLIEGVALAKGKGLRVALEIAGRGPERPFLENLALELGVSQDVVFLGYCDRNQVRDLYARAAVLVVPSIWEEQFGLVGPEAMAAGIPCIGSAVGGIPEWLSAESGRLVSPRSASDLASALLELLGSKGQWGMMSDAARQIAYERFHESIYASNIKNLLEQTVDITST